MARKSSQLIRAVIFISAAITSSLITDSSGAAMDEVSTNNGSKAGLALHSNM